MPDFVTLLTEDHRRVEQLFKRFDETADPTVAMEVCRALTVHTAVEEELVYGLYSAKVDNAGAAEARREHAEAKDLVAQIEAMDPGSDDLMPTMTKLKTAVLHHVDEEEHEMFPKMLERIPEIVGTLGADIAARAAELSAGLPTRSPRPVG